MPHDADFSAALDRTVTRLRRRDALRAVAIGGAAAALTMAIARGMHAAAWMVVASGAPAFALAAAAAFSTLRRGRSAPAAARAVERSDPSLRNLVITA